MGLREWIRKCVLALLGSVYVRAPTNLLTVEFNEPVASGGARRGLGQVFEVLRGQDHDVALEAGLICGEHSNADNGGEQKEEAKLHWCRGVIGAACQKTADGSPTP